MIGCLYFVLKKEDQANNFDAEIFLRNEAEEWHYKIGYLSNRDLNYVIKNRVVSGDS